MIDDAMMEAVDLLWPLSAFPEGRAYTLGLFVIQPDKAREYVLGALRFEVEWYSERIARVRNGVGSRDFRARVMFDDYRKMQERRRVLRLLEG